MTRIDDKLEIMWAMLWNLHFALSAMGSLEIWSRNWILERWFYQKLPKKLQQDLGPRTFVSLRPPSAISLSSHRVLCFRMLNFQMLSLIKNIKYLPSVLQCLLNLKAMAIQFPHLETQSPASIPLSFSSSLPCWLGSVLTSGLGSTPCPVQLSAPTHSWFFTLL